MESKGTLPSESADLQHQFREYMHQINTVIGSTMPQFESSGKVSEDKELAARDPMEGLDNLTKFSLNGFVPPLDLGDNLYQPMQSSVLHSVNPRIFEHRTERANVAAFLKEFDQLKDLVTKLREKNELLHKDKAYLVGRNAFLEKSYHQLNGTVASANTQLEALQRDRERMLKNARAIHEEDRAHYLESFQKAIRNLDAEKIKGLSKALRKQVHSYATQIRDLKLSKQETVVELTALKQEFSVLRKKLTSAELNAATSHTANSQEFIDVKLQLAAKTHEAVESNHRLQESLKNVKQLQSQINFLDERNQITLKELQRMKNELEDEVHRLSSTLRQRDGKLEVYEKLTVTDVRDFKTKLIRDTQVEAQQIKIDELERKILKLQAALTEKNQALQELNDKMMHARRQEVEELSQLVKEQHDEITRLASVIQNIKEDLRSEREALKRVRKTRDELFEVVTNPQIVS